MVLVTYLKIKTQWNNSINVAKNFLTTNFGIPSVFICKVTKLLLNLSLLHFTSLVALQVFGTVFALLPCLSRLQGNLVHEDRWFSLSSVIARKFHELSFSSLWLSSSICCANLVVVVCFLLLPSLGWSPSLVRQMIRFTSTDWKERKKIKVARRYFIKWKGFFC